MKDFLPAQEVKNLRSAHRIEKDRKRAATIRRYEKKYQESRIDGLLEDHYHGSPGYLTNQQEIELTKYLKTNLHQTAKEVAAYINRTYKVAYSVEGATQLLHRLGFVYKKTKIVPGKVSPGLQRCFKDLYVLIKKMKEPEDKIYFLDGTHPVHNNKPCYGWIYIDTQAMIRLFTELERKQPKGAITAIVDNASYNHSRELNSFLESTSG